MKLKLLFDCDDTLYDLSWPFKSSVEQLIAYDQRKHIDLEQFYMDYRKAGDEIFDRVQNGEISIDDSGIYRIKKACAKYGIDISDKEAEIFQRTYKTYQKEIHMAPELEAYLATTDFELGVLTNGENAHQRAKCKALGIFDYIPENHVFTSGGIGYAKPDSRAFRHVLKSLNESAEDWYYIGDNYIHDMEGAKAVGMHTIHFNRHHQQEGSASDFTVYSEKELIELLKELSNQ